MSSPSAQPIRNGLRWSYEDKRTLVHLRDRERLDVDEIAQRLFRTKLAVEKKITELKQNEEWAQLYQAWSPQEIQQLLYVKLITQETSEPVVQGKAGEDIDSKWNELFPLILARVEAH